MATHKYTKQEATSNLFEIKIELNRIFERLIDRVHKRRDQLLSQVEDFLSDYEDFRKLSVGEVESTGPTEGYANFLIEDMPIEEFRDEPGKKKLPTYTLSCDIEELEKYITEFGRVDRVTYKPPIPPKRSLSVQSASKSAPLKIGGRGASKGYYEKPRGIGISNNDVIVLADQGRQVVTIMSINGSVIAEFKQESPYGVCIHEDSVFVSDLKRDTIFLYSLARMSLEKYSREKGALQAPKGLDYDKNDGILYIADTLKHSIVQMNKRLEYLGEFGGAAKLYRPEDVKLHPQTGSLVVLDHGDNGMIHIFNTNGHKLETIGIIHKPQILAAYFFCIDQEGNYVVSDTERHSLTVFDSNGGMVRIIGQEGERLGDLKYPRGVCCRRSDNKYISASSNEKFTIQMY
ncbi:NHL repeat containing protein [Oopsacas minuta]|uniref:NHL repeat containing protein n=1 Tax=Oopsacas minuta TaxID=111878 RepID=A0AAV7JDM4_9METZ|nr:NHL repeat containing protein [Oopsacas minuta]